MPVQIDSKDIILKYRYELYAVETTVRPHNVRVVIESPRQRRQKIQQEKTDAQLHIEAEEEAMKVFRQSLKQSAVQAEKKIMTIAEVAPALVTASVPEPAPAKTGGYGRRATVA
jgi:hypothetical protein